MYTKHNTEGIVLEAMNVGESSRLYRLLTPDMGMVHARAQGSRELKSRHRYALQPLSFVNVSLVRAKHGWRVTNAAPRHSLLSLRDKKFLLALRVLRLVKRLVAGEEKNEIFYASLSSAFRTLLEEELSDEKLKNLEALAVLRILHHLGYVKGEVFEEFFSSPEQFDTEILEVVGKSRRKIVFEINRAISASQL